MHYLATVNYSGEVLDKQGNPKTTKVKVLVEADSVEEATLALANYHKGDTGYDSIDSIRKMPLGDLITRVDNPEFYKQ